ncbi:MAG: OmpA family protein [Hyalangium sp.]|uniref:OmpA family protein n=1 Tax=Hyalangium sp. TaxID=2028555 RepID=UPI00389A6487
MPRRFIHSRTGNRLPTGEEVEVQLPLRILRTRLKGLHFESDKTFLLPSAMSGLRQLRRLYDEHPGAAVLVSGHADTSGAAEHNLHLSEARAQAVAAFLQDQVEEWLHEYEAVSRFKPWGTREDQHMLSVLQDSQGPFYVGPVNGLNGSATQAAVRRFQQWFNAERGGNLTEDGLCGPKTRRAIIGEYMAQDGTTLPAGTDLAIHGCGEAHPEVDTGDGVQAQENRRVEIFFFRARIIPPPQTPCPPGGCPEYLAWVESTVRTIDLDGVDQEIPFLRLVPPVLSFHGNVLARLEPVEPRPLPVIKTLSLGSVEIEEVWHGPDGNLYFIPPSGVEGPVTSLSLNGGAGRAPAEPAQYTRDPLESVRSLSQQMEVLAQAAELRVGQSRTEGESSKETRLRYEVIRADGDRRLEEALVRIAGAEGFSEAGEAITTEFAELIERHGQEESQRVATLFPGGPSVA